MEKIDNFQRLRSQLTGHLVHIRSLNERVAELEKEKEFLNNTLRQKENDLKTAIRKRDSLDVQLREAEKEVQNLKSELREAREKQS